MIKTRARIMKVVAAAAIGFLVAGMSATAATADPAEKVWVCKYVGTPGVDEVLKRGNDGLINVSANTLKDQEIAIGAFFPDAQGRSLVVQIGGERPDVSLVCPGYEVPVTAEEPTLTPVCGPNNDVVNLPSTKGVKYTATAWDHNELTVTATEESGYALSGKSTWKLKDKHEACPVVEQFVTIIWNMNPVGPPPVFNPAQTIKDHKVTSTPQLNAFNDLLVGKCVGYQVDVYKYTKASDIKAVDNLIDVGILTGPGAPAEPLIDGGHGVAWKFYQNADCAQEPEVVSPVFPDPVPPTCDADGALPSTPTTPGVTYTWDGNTLYAAPESAEYVFPAGTELSRPYTVGTAIGYQSTDAGAECFMATVVTPVFPDPAPPTCDADGTLPSTPTTEGIVYTWVGNILTATPASNLFVFSDGAQESRTYDDLGTAIGYQSTDAGAECFMATVVTPVFPDPAPPTCDADGTLPSTPTTEGIVYTWVGNILTATPASNLFVFSDGAQESRTYDDLGTAIGYQSNNVEGACYSENPEPLSGNVESSTGQCTAPLDGTYTTVTTTTPWTQEWVLDTATGLWDLGEKVNGTPVVTETVTADGTCVVELTEATPAAPTVAPICGPQNDVVTIVPTTGVVYTDKGWDGSSHTITAAAAEGYTLTGQASWTFVDEAVACPIEITDTAVTPEPPTVVAKCLPNNDTVTLPTTVGVVYTAGEWFDGKLTVTAAAAEGYTLIGDETSWTFTDVPSAACPDEEPVFSYVPSAQLAQTGTSDGTLGLAVLAMLLISTGAVLVSRKVRVQ